MGSWEICRTIGQAYPRAIQQPDSTSLRQWQGRSRYQTHLNGGMDLHIPRWSPSPCQWFIQKDNSWNGFADWLVLCFPEEKNMWPLPWEDHAFYCCASFKTLLYNDLLRYWEFRKIKKQSINSFCICHALAYLSILAWLKKDGWWEVKGSWQGEGLDAKEHHRKAGPSLKNTLCREGRCGAKPILCCPCAYDNSMESPLLQDLNMPVWWILQRDL